MPEESKTEKRVRISNALHDGLKYSLGLYEYGANLGKDPKMLKEYEQMTVQAPKLAEIAYNDDKVQAAFEELVQKKLEVEKAVSAISIAHGDLVNPEIDITVAKGEKTVEKTVTLKGFSLEKGAVEITLKGDEAKLYIAVADSSDKAEQALNDTYSKVIAGHKEFAGISDDTHDVMKQSMAFAAKEEAEALFKDMYFTRNAPAYDADKEKLLAGYRKGEGATTTLPYDKIAVRSDDKGTLAV